MTNEYIEAAKALSTPITKLIEVVAAGCGRLHEPSHIRRVARAQADALLLMAEAKSRASDIAVRAASRALDLEVYRQLNIEAVTQKAIEALDDVVSPEPVDTDWSVKWVQACQDVSDGDMQTLWAKLLAGEVEQPGSFSLRTISRLSHLSRSEAMAFESLCRESPTIGRVPTILIFSPEDPLELASCGLQYARQLNELQEAGLISLSEMGLHYRPQPGSAMHFKIDDERILTVVNAKPEEKFSIAGPGAIEAGLVNLTTTGAQLAKLVPQEVSAQRLDFIVRAFQGFDLTVEVRRAGSGSDDVIE